jgi:hypothetical protein
MSKRRAFLAILAGVLLGIASQTPADAQTWLSCKWHETWYSFSFLGSSSREDKSEHDFSKTYVYTSGSNYLQEYSASSQSLQYVDGADIQPDQIGIVTKDHYDDPGLGGHSKSERTWTLDRRTLQVSVIFSSTQDLLMGDGRMSNLRMNGSGSGSCTLIDPQPIEPQQPNKF